ncbi:unnamed protein product, partial [Rotaria sp. Silwood1]
MASNLPAGGWSVKIVSLPASITFFRLAKILSLPTSRIFVSKVKSNEIPYAWINGFVNEEEANTFATQWSGLSILGETIKCVAAAPRTNARDTLNSPRESLTFGIKTLSDNKLGVRSNRKEKEERENYNPSTTTIPILTTITSEMLNITIHDDDTKKKSRKLPSHYSTKNANSPKQADESDQRLQQAETSAYVQQSRAQSSQEPHFVCQFQNCNNRCDGKHVDSCVNRYGKPRQRYNDCVGRKGSGHFFRYYDGECDKCGDCFDNDY